MRVTPHIGQTLEKRYIQNRVTSYYKQSTAIEHNTYVYRQTHTHTQDRHRHRSFTVQQAHIHDTHGCRSARNITLPAHSLPFYAYEKLN